MLDISEQARISPLADIEDSIKGSRIIIDADVVVDAFVKIKPAGGTGDVRIGSGSVINSGCVIYTGNGVTLGKNVLVAANCTFASANHAFSDRNKTIREQRFLPSRGGIVVEDDVWIGANCVLLDGTYVAQGCVIGAGSIVSGRLEPFGIYVGSPLRKISERR